MTDAVKMAIEALIKANKALPNPSAKTGKFAEIRADIAESLAALEQAGEPVAEAPKSIILEMIAADTAHVMWERRWQALSALNYHNTNFVDRDGKWALSDFIAYAGEACGFHRDESPLPTLQSLGQEFDAGEGDALIADANSWYSQTQLGEIANDTRGRISDVLKELGKPEYITMKIGPGAPNTHGRWCWDSLHFTADDVVAIVSSLYAQSPVAAEPVGLRASARALLADISDHPDVSRRLSGKKIMALSEALATPSQPDPQSRGQAFEGEGEAREDLAPLDVRVFVRVRGEIYIARRVRFFTSTYAWVCDDPLVQIDKPDYWWPFAALSSAKRGEEG